MNFTANRNLPTTPFITAWLIRHDDNFGLSGNAWQAKHDLHFWLGNAPVATMDALITVKDWDLKSCKCLYCRRGITTPKA